MGASLPRGEKGPHLERICQLFLKSFLMELSIFPLETWGQPAPQSQEEDDLTRLEQEAGSQHVDTAAAKPRRSDPRVAERERKRFWAGRTYCQKLHGVGAIGCYKNVNQQT